MKKISIFTLVFFFCQNKINSQTFDTLNFIDNLSKYIVFLDKTKTSKICKAFKNSSYFSHSANRKPYPEYVLNNQYYEKHKITEVDFVSFWQIDSAKNYLEMFAFYSPVKDSSYISNKLINDGWEKEVFLNDLKAIYRKTINGKNYLINNQKFPDNETARYYIDIPH